MKFFKTETTSKKKKDHTIWAEKYRPSDFSSFVGNEALTTAIQNIIDTKDIQHMMFYGAEPGTGKTTIAKLIASYLDCDVMYVNASDETKIDFIREKIKPFAQNNGVHPLKIVILDESDYLSHNAQASLRNLMETYSSTTKFILTCNYIERIITPISSRCQTYEVVPPNKKSVAVILSQILTNENVKFELPDVATVVNMYYPDIRKCINYCQQSSVTGTLKVTSTNITVAGTVKQKIVDYLVNSKHKSTKITFTDIRQLIADSGVRKFEELYSELYENLGKFTDESNVGPVILELAKYSFQNSTVINKELTFMACITSILNKIK